MEKKDLINLLNKLENIKECNWHYDVVLSLDEEFLTRVSRIKDGFWHYSLTLVIFHLYNEDIFSINELKNILDIFLKYHDNILAEDIVDDIFYKFYDGPDSSDVKNAIPKVKFINKDDVLVKYGLVKDALELLLSVPNLNRYDLCEPVKVLKCEEAAKAGIALEGAKLLINTKNRNAVSGAYSVLTSEYAIKAEIALNAAKIILKANNEIRANEASQLFYCDPLNGKPNAVLAGIALEGAKLILKSASDDIGMAKIRVLNNENAINAGIAIEGAKLLDEATNKEACSNASFALINKDLIDKNIAMEGARLIISHPLDESATYKGYAQGHIYKILTNPYLLSEGKSLEYAKLFNELQFLDRRGIVEEILTNETLDKLGLAKEGAIIASNAKTFAGALAIGRILNSYLVLNQIVDHGTCLEAIKIISEETNHQLIECMENILNCLTVVKTGNAIKYIKKLQTTPDFEILTHLLISKNNLEESYVDEIMHNVTSLKEDEQQFKYLVANILDVKKEERKEAQERKDYILKVGSNFNLDLGYNLLTSKRYISEKTNYEAYDFITQIEKRPIAIWIYSILACTNFPTTEDALKTAKYLLDKNDIYILKFISILIHNDSLYNNGLCFPLINLLIKIKYNELGEEAEIIEKLKEHKKIIYYSFKNIGDNNINDQSILDTLYYTIFEENIKFRNYQPRRNSTSNDASVLIGKISDTLSFDVNPKDFISRSRKLG